MDQDIQKPAKKAVNTEDADRALAALRDFWQQMNAWEREMRGYSTRLQSGVVSEQEHAETTTVLRARLREIFVRCCESGERAARVSDALHCGGDEEDYNVEKEKVISVTPGRSGVVVIETQMTHSFEFRLPYEMVCRDGRWLVRDNRKRWADFDPKWKRWWL